MFKRPFIYIALAAFLMSIIFSTAAIAVYEDSDYDEFKRMRDEYNSYYHELSGIASISASRLADRCQEEMDEIIDDIVPYIASTVFFFVIGIVFLILAIVKRPRRVNPAYAPGTYPVYPPYAPGAYPTCPTTPPDVNTSHYPGSPTDYPNR